MKFVLAFLGVLTISFSVLATSQATSATSDKRSNTSIKQLEQEFTVTTKAQTLDARSTPKASELAKKTADNSAVSMDDELERDLEASP